MTDITVSTVDFRNAVLATRPHLPDPKADHLTDLCRVHCRIERYGLIVAATNTVTAALAMVDTVDLADGEVGTAFDLGPDEAREIVTLFRPAKKASGESMDSALRLQVDPVDDALVVTDVSGLFPGRSARFPRTGETPLRDFPALGRIIRGALESSVGAEARAMVEGPSLAAFAAAARVYKRSLVWRHVSPPHRALVTCGDAFVGLIALGAPSPEDLPSIEAVEHAWLARLGLDDDGDDQ